MSWSVSAGHNLDTTHNQGGSSARSFIHLDTVGPVGAGEAPVAIGLHVEEVAPACPGPLLVLVELVELKGRLSGT